MTSRGRRRNGCPCEARRRHVTCFRPISRQQQTAQSDLVCASGQDCRMGLQAAANGGPAQRSIASDRPKPAPQIKPLHDQEGLMKHANLPDATGTLPLRQPSSHDLALRTQHDEHGALMRKVAALQRRMDEQVVDQAQRLFALEADNLRLRAELVRSRTAVLWGLQSAAVTTPSRRPTPRVSAPVQSQWRAAQAVICQTGCAGHAYPWLDDQGQCRRTGELCQPQGNAVVGSENDDLGE
jgi:hypothetical protein